MKVKCIACGTEFESDQHACSVEHHKAVRERALEEAIGKIGNVVDTDAPPNRKRDILVDMVRFAYDIGSRNSALSNEGFKYLHPE